VLFLEEKISQTVVDCFHNGIGGFYVEKCDAETHAYLVSEMEVPRRRIVTSKERSSDGLLSPVSYSEVNSEDLSSRFETTGVFDPDKLEDLDVASSVHRDRLVPSELVMGYAQVAATGYLTAESIGRLV
jgi:hypothetical protein